MRLLHFFAKSGNPFTEQTLEEMCRSDYIPDSFITDMIIGKRIDLADVIDRDIARCDSQIPIRIYKPTLASNQPVMMFFHGRGFVIGTVDSYDRMWCQKETLSLKNGSLNATIVV
ncbi:MAG: hypothetical protein ACPG7F_04725 [Aggregatilineales bacterium]